MPSLRVVLAEDHPIMRVGIRRLLERSKEPQIEIVGEAENGKQALDLVKEMEPDVLLLDVEMPEMSGDQVARALSEEGSEIPILALSGHNESSYIIRMLTSGAAGYMTKEEAPAKLVEAIVEVSQGRKAWLSPRIAEKMGLTGLLSTDRPAVSLSRSEKNILRLVACGTPVWKMAEELGLSPEELDQKLDEIKRKLGSKTRLEAAILALRDGLI